MRKLIKVKMMYPWSSNITQMTIKMKMNQYKDDIHQDEDDDHQTQRWIANKTYQSRDRWRSLREFGQPASDSLPRGWSRWSTMFLGPDQDVTFQNAIQEYNVLCHDILWMVMSSTSTMWSLTRIRPSQPATESSTTLWTLGLNITFSSFTFLIQLHSSIFSIMFWTLMFCIVFLSLHFFIHFQAIYLHIDVQLVGDAVNHVDADDADSKTWWRGQAGFHHKVDVDLREINLKTILKEQQSTKKQAC